MKSDKRNDAGKDRDGERREGFEHKAIALLGLILLLTCIGPFPAHGAALSDSAINLAVDRQLGHDANIPANLITTSTKDGVVTLIGTVNNLLAKERSEKIVTTVKGVRSVVNLITVLPLTDRSDEKISDDIVMALLSDPEAVAYEIKVGVKDGVATLSGTVDSYQEGVLAGNIAKGVPGVVELQNDITFVPKKNRSDKDIKTDITERFIWDVWVNASAFNITVHDAEVKITGTARSDAEMERAGYLAWVAGVKTVDTSGVDVDWSKANTMIRDWEPPVKSDSEIRQAVKDAYKYDPRLVGNNFTVLVENGVVVLTGTTKSILEKNAAESDAEDTLGVQRVKNMIKVQPVTAVSDEDIKKSIEDAYKKNMYVSENQVEVSVLLGRVFLSGTVESFFEKDQAAELAAKQKGVVDVDNNIAVYHGPPDSEDWEILQDIRTELRWSPFVDADRIEVSVKDGTAYLSGEVNTVNERYIAEKNAYEGGAVDVIDYLKVKDNPNF